MLSHQQRRRFGGLFDVYERSRVDCEAEECFGYGPVASFPRLQVRPLWFRIITGVRAEVDQHPFARATETSPERR